MKLKFLSTFFAAISISGAMTLSAQAQEDLHINRSVETLAKGDPVFGLFTANFSLANARGLARSGLDYILIDMEHTPFNTETLQHFLIGLTDKMAVVNQGNTQMRTTPIVRLPANGRNDPEWMVKQILDVGAFGIMFPYVETAEQAERAVAAMRFLGMARVDFRCVTGKCFVAALTRSVDETETMSARYDAPTVKPSTGVAEAVTAGESTRVPSSSV